MKLEKSMDRILKKDTTIIKINYHEHEIYSKTGQFSVALMGPNIGTGLGGFAAKKGSWDEEDLDLELVGEGINSGGHIHLNVAAIEKIIYGPDWIAIEFKED